eukprot:scaffold20665_cov59-Phaeocystis_antarctica.AAC.3
MEADSMCGAWRLPSPGWLRAPCWSALLLPTCYGKTSASGCSPPGLSAPRDPRLEVNPRADLRRAECERGEGDARSLELAGVEREGERAIDTLLHEVARGAPVEEDAKLAAVLGGVVLV